MYSGFHTQRAIAASASFWAGLLFSFAMQKFVAFQDFQKEIKAISRQIAWYGVLVGFNYTLTVIIVSLFPGKEIIFSRTLAVAITTTWNFLFYKRIIFRNKDVTKKHTSV
jgi:putative flippase GtrA